MPINTTHPEYDEASPIWQDIRTAIKGSRAVKAAGDKYLPKLYEQEQGEYENYKLRAIWYGATSKTADGYVGIITRKPINFTNGDALQPFLDDCDRRGTSFNTYAQAVIRQLVEVSRCGTLIDWTTASEPYLTQYTAEQIINWDTRKLGGEKVLSFLMLQEETSEFNALSGHEAPDEYERPSYEQWREFRLIGDTPETATVTMKLHRRRYDNGEKKKGSKTPDASDDFVTIQTSTLTRRGIPVRAIPFIFHTAANIAPECCAKPLLEDLAELNFAHYRASADIWNGRHMAGLPTPWAVCFTDETTKTLTLGTSKAWTSDNKDAKAGILEMSGAALQTIADGMAEIEQQMAALGARAIEPAKKDAEAVGTVLLRARAETASLVAIAEQASTSLSQVMLWANWLVGTHERPQDEAKNVYAVIPSDMTAGKMDATTLTALVGALQSNAISFEVFFHNLQAGEMYPDARTLEEEQSAIEQGPPAPPLPEVPPGSTPPGA